MTETLRLQKPRTKSKSWYQKCCGVGCTAKYHEIYRTRGHLGNLDCSVEFLTEKDHYSPKGYFEILAPFDSNDSIFLPSLPSYDDSIFLHGDSTFTSALIRALDLLARSRSSFTTRQLLGKINDEAPNLPRHQRAVLIQHAEDHSHSFSGFVLTPASEASTTGIELGRDNTQQTMRRQRPNPENSNANTLSDEFQTTVIFQSTQTHSTNPPAQNCKICKVIFLFWMGLAAFSLIIGLWRSIVTGDEGKGFTDAAYVVAVGGLILFPIQTRHYKHCKEVRNN